MLLERDNLVTADWLDEPPARRPEPAPAARARVPAAAPLPAPGGRYGEGRRWNASSLAMAAFVHIGVFAALLGLGHEVVKEQRATLTVVDLSPPPPPPPPPPAPAPPEPRKAAVTVPPPLVRIETPRPRQVVPVSLDIPPAPAVDPQPVPVPAPVAAPAPATPAIVSANDLGTRMVSGSPPRYPVESRRRKEQGTVELLVVLGLDGRVESISVSRSSGYSRLDHAALGAVRRWRWSPTMRDGAAVKVRGVVEIPFVLQGVE